MTTMRKDVKRLIATGALHSARPVLDNKGMQVFRTRVPKIITSAPNVHPDTVLREHEQLLMEAEMKHLNLIGMAVLFNRGRARNLVRGQSLQFQGYGELYGAWKGEKIIIEYYSGRSDRFIREVVRRDYTELVTECRWRRA